MNNPFMPHPISASPDDEMAEGEASPFASPMVGAHAALAHDVMTFNPVTSAPTYDQMSCPQIWETTRGSDNSYPGMNPGGAMQMGPGGMGAPGAATGSQMPGSMKAPMYSGGNPPSDNMDINAGREQRQQPDVKKMMMEFLADKAKARRTASEKYQSQAWSKK